MITGLRLTANRSTIAEPARLVPRVRHHFVHCFRGALGNRVLRNPVFAQDGHALRNDIGAHEAGKDRLLEFLRHAHDLLRRADVVGHLLRGEDDHQAVHRLARQQDFHGLAVGFAGRIAQHVHGIVHRRRGRQQLLKLRAGVVVELRHCEAGHFDGVGHHDAGAARVGDDGDPVAGRQRLVCQGGDDVEQVLYGFDPDNARALERAVVRRVGARKASRVRRRRRRARLRCGPL